jgi:hypothetical protein
MSRLGGLRRCRWRDDGGSRDGSDQASELRNLRKHKQPRVEQPVVVAGQFQRSGLAAVQVADVLTRAVVNWAHQTPKRL